MRRLRSAVPLLAAVILLGLVCVTAGCRKRSFAVLEKRIVGSVNATGKPGPTKTSFLPTDTEAILWFRYVAAPENCEVRCEVIYTDPSGNSSDHSITQTLKPGNGTAQVSLRPAEADTLPPGTYQIDLIGAQGSLFGGSKLTFTVAAAPK